VEERYESQLAHSTRVLDDVDRALERLSAGIYDACETCGGPIPDADLALDPTRRLCHQHRAETNHVVDYEADAVDTDLVDVDEPAPVLVFEEFP
jgi:RNA polymerase-binding transcription factor DksA